MGKDGNISFFIVYRKVASFVLKKHFCYFLGRFELGDIGFDNFGAQIPPPGLWTLWGPKLSIDGGFKNWNIIFYVNSACFFW